MKSFLIILCLLAGVGFYLTLQHSPEYSKPSISSSMPIAVSPNPPKLPQNPSIQIKKSKKTKVKPPHIRKIKRAFAKQGIRISKRAVMHIKEKVYDALNEAHLNGIGNSKVDFISIEIAQILKLDIGVGSKTVHNITSAIDFLLKRATLISPPYNMAWEQYYNKTLSLNTDRTFLSLVKKEKF